ncbi:MAG: CDP-diacylglycerol--glycerol-3-phosphate 3-phosphatidyltransferase [Elusimicrobia bacterium CG_4_10_14_0_8_um_filter_37_32]|nr:MAG: CDP-diacylglycerol--glycerol-3-phosphate 3-phosphatidyltransferase [Elusimicrobia bacterium CG02_land_8_20_14_3_00_37_13]PIZ14099.1 MAG: CDP-diacylglycerol--glycerol-3-phosphate 3-phosphatidyltransferase [Elusimicrobia bacterium CG_4_10_14_0_8_um_filter_37_32]
MTGMTIATKLTLLRVILIPVFVVLMFINNLWTWILSLIIFIIAALTDAFDGFLARKFNDVSKFGIFFDPLADKLLISSAFITFVGLPELGIPAWMVVLIISREFIITGLRLIAMSQGKVVSADLIGKFKTTSQIIVIIIILVIIVFHSFSKSQGYENYSRIALILLKLPFWLTLSVSLVTAYSGISYIYRHRDIIKLEFNNKK